VVPITKHHAGRPIARALLAWFRANARDLPWRRNRTPYTAWLAEIMLQQTRVEQGTPYFERFVAAFPAVQDLAAAAEDEVLKQWEGLGYYSRARNLHRAARIIVEEYGGCFPRTASGWMGLPGIGRYTAGAIASMAFGERTPVLDGNVIRVLARVFDISDCVDDTKTRKDLWAIAESLVPEKDPGSFNEAIMELGAQICRPRQPRCGECPLRRLCRAHAEGRPESRPVRRPAKTVPHRDMVAAVIRRNGNVLIARRPPKGLLGGLWEFPGGEIQNGESHADALRRLLSAHFGISVSVGRAVMRTDHAYSHFRVTLHSYGCRILRGAPAPDFHTEFQWVAPAQLQTFAFPKVQHPLAESVVAQKRD